MWTCDRSRSQCGAVSSSTKECLSFSNIVSVEGFFEVSIMSQEKQYCLAEVGLSDDPSNISWNPLTGPDPQFGNH